MNLYALGYELMLSAGTRAKLGESPYEIKALIVKDTRYKGGEYSFYLVQGRNRQGERVRKKFASQEDALECKAQLDLNYWNEGAAMRPVLTKFSEGELAEFDYCLSRLRGRYRLIEAVEYFLAHHQGISQPTPLRRAIDQFRAESEGRIRERTLVQLKSVLKQFEEAIGRDALLHEITTQDVERFLRSIRAKDRVSPATRKTWNNYRGDLHAFFGWCADKGRRWLSSNPVADAPRFRIDSEHIEVLKLEDARALMRYVAEFKSGKLVWYFALALFAGVRPGGELEKLAKHQQLIDLSNKVVRITAAISKTGSPRQIKIRENLHRWLTAFPGEILPVNCDRELKAVRKRFALSHDVLRHTFISMHIGAFKSFADAALESGNSEKIIRDHYLNTSASTEAEAFWRIYPSDERGES